MSPKLILISMIKNEGKIISRCLDAVKDLVDAVCITDTGSTDNTLEVCHDYLTAWNKPFKIYTTSFKNFGFTRTESFKNTLDFVNTELKWDLVQTYGLLLDADMVLVNKGFDINYLTMYDEGQIVQKFGTLEWYNTRFIKMSLPWKCIGSTHEVWNVCIENRPQERLVIQCQIYIDDISDGGCKADKYTRDIKLLHEDLENPNASHIEKTRAYFYLGQTYMCMGEYENAIKFYQKRVSLGEWVEEQWYAQYSLAKCTWLLNHNIEETHELLLKAVDIRPSRAEPFAALSELYLGIGDYKIALDFVIKGKILPFPKTDILNVEKNVYDYVLDMYELTCRDALNIISHDEAIKKSLHILSHDRPEVLPMIVKYIKPFADCEILHFMDHTPTLHSLNFTLNSSDDVVLLFNEKISINETILHTLDNMQNTKLTVIDDLIYFYNETSYGNLKDGIMGSTPSKFSMFYNSSLKKLDFIKQLCPFETTENGVIDGYPKFLKYFVSLLPGVYYKNSIYFMIISLVENVAFHMLLEVDKDTLKFIRHSDPFYFSEKGLESCISFCITKNGDPTILFNLNSQYKIFKDKNNQYIQ